MSGIGPIHWQHYTHEQLWQIVEQADPETMFTEAEKLRKLADHLGDVTTQAHGVAQDVLGAWDGQAAGDAAGRITEFLGWADKTANTANSIAGLLSQYAHVLNRARLTMPVPPSASGTTSAQAADSKTEAVHVMEHYAGQSRDIYAQLGQHTFTAPPSGTGMPLPPPAPEPHPPVHQPPTPPSSQPDPTAPSSVTTTTPSDFTGTPGSLTGGMPGMPGLPGGGGLPGVGLPGAGSLAAGLTGSGVGSAILGPGAMSGVGDAEAAAGMAPGAGMAADEPAGWNGFAPMPGAGRAAGDQDGSHQDKYAQQSDVIGELPPAFPPVLGL